MSTRGVFDKYLCGARANRKKQSISRFTFVNDVESQIYKNVIFLTSISETGLFNSSLNSEGNAFFNEETFHRKKMFSILCMILDGLHVFIYHIWRMYQEFTYM